MITNILNDLANEFKIRGHLAIFYHLAEEIAKNSSEIVVAGVGEERAAVGKHSDECRDVSGCREVKEVSLHTDLVVKEPPGRAVLNLAASR